jgi:hypothetical protein
MQVQQQENAFLPQKVERKSNEICRMGAHIVTWWWKFIHQTGFNQWIPPKIAGSAADPT